MWLLFATPTAVSSSFGCLPGPLILDMKRWRPSFAIMNPCPIAYEEPAQNRRGLSEVNSYRGDNEGLWRLNFADVSSFIVRPPVDAERRDSRTCSPARRVPRSSDSVTCTLAVSHI